MRVPVRKFREAALWKIHGDDAPTDWNRGRAAFEYIFYKRVRQLKIDTPGFSKINVYCGEQIEIFQGHVWDGCVEVHVPVGFKELAKTTYEDVPYVAFDLMMTGVKTVFDYFNLEWQGVHAIAEQMKQEKFSFSEDLGPRMVKNETRTLGARLRCTSDDRFEHCLIVADIYRQSKRINTISICTALPWPDMVKEDFIELRWIDESKFIAEFKHGFETWRDHNGRHHFDPSGFDGVAEHRVLDPGAVKRITAELHVDLTGLKQAAI